MHARLLRFAAAATVITVLRAGYGSSTAADGPEA
jgi:hypothetical protein